MPLCEFSRDIGAGGAARAYRKVAPEAADIGREVRRHGVTPRGVAIECSRDDGIEVATHAPLLDRIDDLCRGARRIDGHRGTDELRAARGARPERVLPR